MNPVGPEEPSTYWRRRAIVVVGLLAAIWLVWGLLGTAFGGSGEQATDGPGQSTGVGWSISVADSPGGAVSPMPSNDAISGSPAPSASASAACADTDIAVSVAADSASAAAGAGIGLTMTVTNTSDTACLRDVGAGANELQVTSGSVLVWSSDFCNASDTADQQTLQPGQAWSTSLTWPGTVVAKNCPSNPPTAQPGGYKATARNGTVTSEPVSFTVQ